MQLRELIKQMQAEFDAGQSRYEIYQKYKGSSLSQRRLVVLVSALKDKALIEKYKTANHVLIGLMAVISLITAMAGLGLGIPAGSASPLYWGVSALVPLLFMYGFIRVNHEAYLIYAALAITQLPRGFLGFGQTVGMSLLELGLGIGLIALALFLKAKLFPYMGLMGAKQDKDKNYLVAMAD